LIERPLNRVNENRINQKIDAQAVGEISFTVVQSVKQNSKPLEG